MIKSNKIEKEKRVRIVQEWILQDHITTDIVDNCVAKWGISDRQAMRYIKDADNAFARITEKKLERRLNYHIQRRKKLLRDMSKDLRNTPEGTRAQQKVLEDIAKLEGLYIARIDHTTMGKEIVTASEDAIRELASKLK